MLFKQRHHLLQQSIFECTAALDWTRDGPKGHTGLAAVMKAALTDIRGMLLVYYLLCPLAV